MPSEKAIIFSAPSGSGKTTLVKYCLKRFSQLEFSITATTRPPRGDEAHERDYYFISPDEFKEKISEDEFLEYEEVYPNKFYGTLKSEVKRIWDAGKIVIFDVDVKGGVNLKKSFGEKALAIFIAPPCIEELERRLINRNTDDNESIKVRVMKAEQEMLFRNQFDKVIVNDKLATAKAEISSMIEEFIK